MTTRARFLTLALALLACCSRCGRPGPGPEDPGPPAPDTSTSPDAADAPEDVASGDAAEELPPSDAPGDPSVEDVEEEEVFDEEAALAKLKLKKVPKIPKFKPSKHQEVAAPEELEYLMDHERTNDILANAPWAKVPGEKTLVPMIRVRKNDGTSYRFRILIGFETDEEDDDGEPEGDEEAEEREVITGFFKPRQSNYWDWLKEIHAYEIGRRIGAPTVPTVMRFMKKSRFSFFLSKISVDLQNNFKWEKQSGENQPMLRGAFKYWVPSYRHRTFGSRVIGETYMEEIARSLHPMNKKKLREDHDLYLQLGRGIVFDYLIINEDRPENLGTILMEDGSYHIVLIDNGLALGVEHGGRTVMKNMFRKMKIYPKDMIDRIEALEKDEIDEMLRPPDDPVMWIPEVCVEQLWKRRQYILDRVEERHQMYGDVIWY